MIANPQLHPVVRLVGSKAEVLKRLQGISTLFVVPPLELFTAAEWGSDRTAILKNLSEAFPNGRVAVRSSARIEDGGTASFAGAFTSVLAVDPQDVNGLTDAVEAVLASYGGDPQDQVFVQCMVEDIAVSGVIMTHNIDDGSPYYVLNYDDVSGQTDTVTGGTGIHKTVYVHRAFCRERARSLRINHMLEIAEELERLCGNVPMDIEFCLTKSGQAHVLQVRRIANAGRWHPDIGNIVTKRLPFVERHVREASGPRFGIAGNATVLANMPDWNPAEMLGETPRPLATSLYHEIITKDIWRLARERMGYRPMPAEPLMMVLEGRPYIDVRNSFNSFLPPGLDSDTENTLIDAWLDRLREHPEFHDKVEFDVAFTIYDFDFEPRFEERYPGLLSRNEFTQYTNLLRSLTQDWIRLDTDGTLSWSKRQIATLQSRQQAYDRNPSDDPTYLVSRIRTLLEDCRNFGTLPFSILARDGFIAETLLRSAAVRNAVSASRLLEFRRSIHTIAHDLLHDVTALMAGDMEFEVFMDRFGHLRPGTYDIRSMRYANRPELFLSNGGARGPAETTHPDFALTAEEKRNLDALMNEAGFAPLDANDLLAFATQAIQGREFAKFVFTRNLSDAIEDIAAWGSLLGLGRDELSYLTYDDITGAHREPPAGDLSKFVADILDRRRIDRSLSLPVRLSYIIRDVDDVYIQPIHRSAPNFITHEAVSGTIHLLDSISTFEEDIKGRIICIESADPGFDWIFSREIKGLITKFGGANSHMAIRASEYGLPAAIGCGGTLFDQAVAAGYVELNCADHVLRPLVHVR